MSRMPGPPLGSAHRHGIDRDAGSRVHDVCVVGSGASGAVVAEYLVRSGLDVLLLECGSRVPPGFTEEALERETPRARARDVGGGWTDRGWPWTTRNLGGGTVFFGGASFRYRPFDFDASHAIHTDLDLRWPYGLAELAPYYAEIEHRLNVCGGDPEEDAVRGPPHPLDATGDRLWRAAVASGYKPFPTPLAINSISAQGRPACDARSPCIGYACATGAKADAVNIFLAPIADTPGFTLRTGVHALGLVATTRSRIDRIACVDVATGERAEYRARCFVLACNAIQTAALLLRSNTEGHPYGVGNAHHMVGRALCMKNSEYVVGTLDGMETSDTGPFSTVSICDHYLDPDVPTGVGGLIYQVRGHAVGGTERGTAKLRLEAIIADHPSRSNRVFNDAQRDKYGSPTPVIDYTTDPRDRARLEYLVARASDLLRACGARDIHTERSYFELGSAHLHGTCRAGTSPTESVTDGTGRIHDVDNVYLADGAFMPYPGGLNPTLTIQAHALRTATIIGQIRPWSS